MKKHLYKIHTVFVKEGHYGPTQYRHIYVLAPDMEAASQESQGFLDLNCLGINARKVHSVEVLAENNPDPEGVDLLLGSAESSKIVSRKQLQEALAVYAHKVRKTTKDFEEIGSSAQIKYLQEADKILNILEKAL